MDSEVKMEKEQKDKVLVLRLSGRLDAVTSPSIEKQVAEMIDGGQLYLLMDFANISYLSSAGMRMLLATTKKIKTLSGKFILCSVTENVLDVLRMSGFDTVIELADSEDAGLAKF